MQIDNSSFEVLDELFGNNLNKSELY